MPKTVTPPSRYWVVKKPDGQGTVVSRFETIANDLSSISYQIPDSCVAQSATSRSALAKTYLDPSVLTRKEREILNVWGDINSIQKGFGEWKKDANNPVFNESLSGWDSERVFAPALYKDSNGTYHMIYNGTDGSGGAELGHATSSDLTAWTRDDANPVYSPVGTGWQSTSVASPSLVEQDGEYYLFYFGNAGGGDLSIGVASDSTLAGDWPTGSQILTPSSGGSWDNAAVYAPGALYYDGTWYLAYEAHDGDGQSGVGLATATGDPTNDNNWSKVATDPIVPNTEAVTWEKTNTAQPTLFNIDGRLHLFYEGSDDHNDTIYIGHAAADVTDISPSGWLKNPENPLILTSASGWDSANVAQPSVIVDSASKWEMLYMGNSNNTDITTWDIGHATLSL